MRIREGDLLNFLNFELGLELLSVKKSRSIHPEAFLEKGLLKHMQKIYRRTPMSNLLCKFIEITLRRGCSPVNLLHIFRTAFPKNTSGWLLLEEHHTKTNKKCIYWNKSKNMTIFNNKISLLRFSVYLFISKNMNPWFNWIDSLEYTCVNRILAKSTCVILHTKCKRDNDEHVKTRPCEENVGLFGFGPKWFSRNYESTKNSKNSEKKTKKPKSSVKC